ncbi:MAG: hypothetical protein JSV51_04245, partial [Candidatus Bathyarchaeota archaeon]
LPSSVTLELFDTKIVDDSGNPITHSSMDATYMFLWETLIHPIVVANQTYTVVTVSNGSITPVPMVLNSRHKWLTFNITGSDDTMALINVTIPTSLINATHGPWTVLVGGHPVSYGETQINATHVLLTFTVPLSSKPVQIVGDWVIPEFPEVMFLTLLFAMTLIGTAFALALRRRHRILSAIH